MLGKVSILRQMIKDCRVFKATDILKYTYAALTAVDVEALFSPHGLALSEEKTLSA